MLNEGGVAFLVEQFCPYTEQQRREGRILAGDDITEWPTAWRLVFTNPAAMTWLHYDDKWGWSDMNIKNNAYGKLIES